MGRYGLWCVSILETNNKIHNTKIRSKTMANQLEGAKIVKVRDMTKKEADNEYWDLSRNGCRVLVLDNGIKLYASQDYEGNGPGALFFYDKKGGTYAV